MFISIKGAFSSLFWYFIKATQMQLLLGSTSWTRCQNNSINLCQLSSPNQFGGQFYKNSAEKVQSIKDKGIKISPRCQRERRRSIVLLLMNGNLCEVNVVFLTPFSFHFITFKYSFVTKTILNFKQFIEVVTDRSSVLPFCPNRTEQVN